MRILILVTIAALLCGCFGAPRVPDAPLNPFDGEEWSSGFDALFLWSNTISLLMIAVCIGIIIWAPIPALKKWAYLFLTVAAIMFTCGLIFAVVKPWIPWIVLSLIGVMLMIGLWFIVANFHLLKKVIHLDKDEYKNNLTTNEQKIVEQCQTNK